MASVDHRDETPGEVNTRASVTRVGRVADSLSLVGACCRLALPVFFIAVLGCVENVSNEIDLQDRAESALPAKVPVASSEDLMQEAVAAFTAGDFVAAEASLRKQLIADPDDVQALLLAGSVAERLNDWPMSLAFYQDAIRKSESPHPVMLDGITKSLVKSGRVFDAIEVLKTFVRRFENVPDARFDLAGLASMVGMPEAAIPSLRWLFQHNQGDMESLLLMANPARSEADLDFCNELLLRSGDDIRLRYAAARMHAKELEWEKVLERLASVVEQHPNFVPGLVLYGRALVELDRISDLEDWSIRLPPNIEGSPEYWIVIGKWAEASSNPKLAVEAFLTAEQLDSACCPDYLDGLYHSLVELGMGEEAMLVEKKIDQRVRLRDAFNVYLGRDRQSQTAAIAVAEAMADLGRIWEAEAWARHATALRSEPATDLKNRYLKIRSELTADTPWIVDEQRLVSSIELDVIEVTTGDLADSFKRRPKNTARYQTKSRYPSFRDESEVLGFEHTCKLSADAEVNGHWLHQSSGGGIAVLDYDLDSHTDIVVANLDGEPLKANSTSNALYRNIGDRFIAVGTRADYVDKGFAQGIAIGDLNADGFDDIFDANIGQNRIFINNGDGTFSEVANEIGMTDESWTVSAAIADIDGDGNADIYATNYCDGKEPFERPCLENGRNSACAPLLFDAQKDRIWKGDGDGTLTDMTSRWMSQSVTGRGLGVIVANLDERPGLDVYVANDMTANHLWSPETKDGKFMLTDLASVRGVSVNAKSQSQASMGIALGDADDDGDFDLYLTHFSNEYHTYYEQVRPGFWRDRSFQRGLAQPTIHLLGFGTQWCDFDNDGAKELVVTNGHIDDFHQSNVAYRMPGQVFRRTFNGRWEECERSALGDYFREDHLGRALAIADLDSDGRKDVLVTHLYEPVAMLMNRTTNVGKTIAMTLKSTRTHRDAIGAVVTVKLRGRTMVSMLAAGDGYMCSNQRQAFLASVNSLTLKAFRCSGLVEKRKTTRGSLPIASTYSLKAKFHFV
ncbi:FG-GAP repeat domain-containing protein [Rhodopirellula sallentina]|uniref:ASPIC/UnbV domain protein n=1 Tax=Rhodopirellula sallentina SM41 TaxID=1263870 RepID=M5UAI3_9BACT|nr:ASPIC/UnbV domain protein [Rhodopirellula sallentina SM41]